MLYANTDFKAADEEQQIRAVYDSSYYPDKMVVCLFELCKLAKWPIQNKNLTV